MHKLLGAVRRCKQQVAYQASLSELAATSSNAANPPGVHSAMVAGTVPTQGNGSGAAAAKPSKRAVVKTTALPASPAKAATGGMALPTPTDAFANFTEVKTLQRGHGTREMRLYCMDSRDNVTKHLYTATPERCPNCYKHSTTRCAPPHCFSMQCKTCRLYGHHSTSCKQQN